MRRRPCSPSSGCRSRRGRATRLRRRRTRSPRCASRRWRRTRCRASRWRRLPTLVPPPTLRVGTPATSTVRTRGGMCTFGASHPPPPRGQVSTRSLLFPCSLLLLCRVAPHFRRKGPLGPRLSAAALAIVYGNTSVPFRGPEALRVSTIARPCGDGVRILLTVYISCESISHSYLTSSP